MWWAGSNVDSFLVRQNRFDFLQELLLDRVGDEDAGLWRYFLDYFVDIHVAAVLFDHITAQHSHFVEPPALGKTQMQQILQPI